ncbi:[citrate (pro-3S)-lyase] ligase [Lactobacillus agrestimuris]|uniref:[citrate (pro-3S)-lyase] ligase n=1 Tax=Lactobacillus agrestimuris TaxID=2941328 RepID=UPI0020434009|nr:[citrate (pro-3S)-lyase] ligase [Lactobacillus agrestimuris]
MDKVVDLYLNQVSTRKKWKSFLETKGIHDFSDREIDVIDHTLGLIDDEGNLVATGSIAGNVLKYIAVSNDEVIAGARFNKIVSSLQQYLFSNQIFHCFVFTKAKYSSSFKHLGFKELALSEQAAFLEYGDPNIEDYLNNLPQVHDQKNKKVAAVVMNANPFTLGHRYLVEKASNENDLVYVFVVKEDLSLFSTAERMKLVKEGTQDLSNVEVVSGEEYMVSSATFPAYFLKSAAELIDVQTTIDAKVFKNFVAPKLNIKSRYLGEEPFSRTTNSYNKKLQEILSPEVKVIIIPRLREKDKIVNATEVRKYIKTGSLDKIEAFLPKTTYDFIKNNLLELQDRIKKGTNVNGN